MDQKNQELVRSIRSGTSVNTAAEAAQFVEIVILATPCDAVEAALK